MEIRRSVMARPNLSWRGKFLALSFWLLAQEIQRTLHLSLEPKAKSQSHSRKTDRRAHPAAVSFPMRSFERGRRRRSHRHPRDNFLCELCKSSAISAVK